MTTQTKASYKKYTSTERKRIYPRIVALHEAGLASREIAERLEREGFTAPGGIALPEKVSIIHGVVGRYNAGEIDDYLKGTPAKATVSGRVLPDTVLGILTDPTLSDTKKVKMICAYAEIEAE